MIAYADRISFDQIFLLIGGGRSHTIRSQIRVRRRLSGAFFEFYLTRRVAARFS